MPHIELVGVSEDAPEEIRELMKKIHVFQCGKAELTREEWDKWWKFNDSKEFEKHCIITRSTGKSYDSPKTSFKYWRRSYILVRMIMVCIDVCSYLGYQFVESVYRLIEKLL